MKLCGCALIHVAMQRAALGPALRGRDVLARARTGSGKSAAYALPLLHTILAAKVDGNGVFLDCL